MRSGEQASRFAGASVRGEIEPAAGRRPVMNRQPGGCAVTAGALVRAVRDPAAAAGRPTLRRHCP